MRSLFQPVGTLSKSTRLFRSTRPLNVQQVFIAPQGLTRKYLVLRDLIETRREGRILMTVVCVLLEPTVQLREQLIRRRARRDISALKALLCHKSAPLARTTRFWDFTIREIAHRAMLVSIVLSLVRKMLTRCCTSVTRVIIALAGRLDLNPPISPQANAVPLVGIVCRQPQLPPPATLASLDPTWEQPLPQTASIAPLDSIARETQQPVLLTSVPRLTSALVAPLITCPMRVAFSPMQADLSRVSTPPKAPLWP